MIFTRLQTLEQAVNSLTAADQPFALEEVEVRGHRYRSYLNQPRNLTEYLKLMARHGDKEFVVMGDERFSFAEGLQHGAEFAAALQDRFGIDGCAGGRRHVRVTASLRSASCLALGQQPPIDEGVDPAVQHVVDIAHIQVDAVILDHLVGMHDIGSDLAAPGENSM